MQIESKISKEVLRVADMDVVIAIYGISNIDLKQHTQIIPALSICNPTNSIH